MMEKIMDWMKIGRRLAVPVALVLALVMLAAFADKQQRGQRCEKIVVKIADEEKYQFVTEKGIADAVTKNGTAPITGLEETSISLQQIENGLRKNSFIRKVDAHFNMRGDLVITVQQRAPWIRVINPLLQSYYLDEEGKRMPLSDQYTAYVPIATPDYFTIPGNKDSLLCMLDSSLFVLAGYLQKDSFARALTGQIIIEPENEFTLIPRLGNFTIFIGDVADLDDKMTRLKSFYRVSLPQAGWNRYTRISLKYKNQIIANH